MSALNPARTAAEAQALTDRSNPAGIFLNVAEIEWLLGSELRLARTAPPVAELAALECLGFGRHRVAFTYPPHPAPCNRHRGLNLLRG